MSPNDLIAALNLHALKGLAGKLLLPPASPLLLALLGLLLWRRRPRLARALVVLGLVSMWLLCLPAVGLGLARWLTTPPPPLTDAQVLALKGARSTAIVVLGAGRRDPAPEYGVPDLRPLTAERLRYGAWLARRTGLPLAFSGGLAPGVDPGETEAAAATRVAERDLGVRLRWREDRSRDTAENAQFTVALLSQAGITQIVLVTHDMHQRRALAGFERAMQRQGVRLALLPAPMAVPPAGPLAAGDFMPSVEGLQRSVYALHEWLGRLAGA
ncbi:YdcF family protein [Aquabacterium sp. OR-4]|uniref:YdcF family protein n=1 Tax=Aquabacterium sp. OR-4 TaxID=2978127 RepID=UPI0021B29F16|nr:YdcF family protein [Aquabacterium sp. OR-4]MDT7838216.1 YdcF family protein [Aquabacterium sp. OR-4]